MTIVEFRYSDEKNAWLKAQRRISFEDIIAAIDAGAIVDILRHKNEEDYPGQLLLILVMCSEVWAVPAVDEGETMFLKTAYPDRNLRKHYLAHGGTDDKKT